MTVTTWRALNAKEKAAAVRAELSKGASYSQAAEALGTNRNGIASVVNRAATRAGETPITATNRPRRSIPKPPKPKKTTPSKNGYNVFPKRPPLDPTEGEPPEDDRPPVKANAWDALPGSSPVKVEHHHSACRWPIGENPFLFCNEPTAEEHRYCPTHARLGRRDLPPKKRGVKVVGISR